MKNKLIITNIQRMCFHDGPGIRTTVFTKGCTLHCPWCSNPENLSPLPENYEKDGVCGVYGREYTAEELVHTLLKDQDFWGAEGGVTFSGGEVLMRAEALSEVLEKLKELGIHTAVETALFVPEENLQRVLPYIDYGIVDVKILEPALCREVLGGKLELYFRNVEQMYKSGKLMLFRVPCCEEYTFTEDNKKLLSRFFQKYPDISVQIFAIHSLGEKKYQSLGRMMWKAKELEQERLWGYCQELRECGITAEVIRI